MTHPKSEPGIGAWQFSRAGELGLHCQDQRATRQTNKELVDADEDHA